jgi:hypothetical protein
MTERTVSGKRGQQRATPTAQGERSVVDEVDALRDPRPWRLVATRSASTAWWRLGGH